METTRRQHRVVRFLLKAARVVGLRVLLWGGVALAIGLWFGYVRLPVFLLQPLLGRRLRPADLGAPVRPTLRGGGDVSRPACHARVATPGPSRASLRPGEPAGVG